MTGVLKWMKDPGSVQLRGIEAVQNSRGRVIVCGGGDTDFVVVGIGSSDRERAEVTALCRASGIYGSVGAVRDQAGCGLKHLVRTTPSTVTKWPQLALVQRIE